MLYPLSYRGASQNRGDVSMLADAQANHSHFMFPDLTLGCKVKRPPSFDGDL